MKNSYITKLFIAITFFMLSQFAQAETMEVVVFNTKNNVTDQQVTNTATLMLKTMRSWDGFMSRELVKVGDGKWIDVVHWKNPEAAILAQEKAMKSEVCLAFFSLIDEKLQQFYHGEIVLKQNKNMPGHLSSSNTPPGIPPPSH